MKLVQDLISFILLKHSHWLSDSMAVPHRWHLSREGVALMQTEHQVHHFRVWTQQNVVFNWPTEVEVILFVGTANPICGIGRGSSGSLWLFGPAIVAIQHPSTTRTWGAAIRATARFRCLGLGDLANIGNPNTLEKMKVLHPKNMRYDHQKWRFYTPNEGNVAGKSPTLVAWFWSWEPGEVWNFQVAAWGPGLPRVWRNDFLWETDIAGWIFSIF